MGPAAGPPCTDSTPLLFRLVLAAAPAGARLHRVRDEGVPVRDLAEVIGRHLTLPVTAISRAEPDRHFGWLAPFVSLDSPASRTLTQKQPWHPDGLSREAVLADARPKRISDRAPGRVTREEDGPMRHIFRSRPVLTEERHRATMVEIFFDLVFIFALTRVISSMGHPPTPLTLVQGLILLLLLWISWTIYAWLGNQARADVGLIRAGMIVAMAAVFVVALVIPGAWRQGSGPVDAPLTLVLAYIVLRVVHLALYFYAAAEDRRLRTTLRLFTITSTLAWIPLILGVVLGGTAQTLLWAAALAIGFSGGFIASVLSGWRLRSPSHFAERHGLVLIIALGESLISIGTGAGQTVTRGPVLLAALLGLSMTVCLWWLYFAEAAPAAGRRLARLPSERRGLLASFAYSLAHFPLIAGIIYLALGVEQVIEHVTHNEPHHPAGAPLDWASTTALYGGVALYLAGRLAFLRLAVRSTSSAQIIAVVAVLLLLPAARILPALAALGLLAAFLVALVCYERLSRGDTATLTQNPFAAA